MISKYGKIEDDHWKGIEEAQKNDRSEISSNAAWAARRVLIAAFSIAAIGMIGSGLGISIFGIIGFKSFAWTMGVSSLLGGLFEYSRTFSSEEGFANKYSNSLGAEWWQKSTDGSKYEEFINKNYNKTHDPAVEGKDEVNTAKDRMANVVNKKQRMDEETQNRKIETIQQKFMQVENVREDHKMNQIAEKLKKQENEKMSKSNQLQNAQSELMSKTQEKKTRTRTSPAEYF